MFRLKIKDVKLNIDDRVGVKGVLPCSLRTVLAAADGCEPWQVNTKVSAVEFTGTIEIEPHVLAMKHVCLRLTGVSEPAEVSLNGKTISTPESRDRIYVYNVKDRLFPGYNTLSVRFSRLERTESPFGIRLRDGDIYDPAIESVSLLAFNAAAINSVNVTQTHGEGGVTLNVNMGMIGDKSEVRAVATLVSPTGKIYYGGLADGSGAISIPDPLLWWPSGIGVPNLYDLAVNLYHGDSAEDIFEMKIGLRDLNVSCASGSMSVTVGGLPVFLKGIRVIPESFGAEFIDPDRLVSVIASAARVGVNALYVSPYGKAPSDRFLDLCDEHGILVVLGITDKHPADNSLDDNAKREIVDGPRRISYHASLAAFYINSEITPNAYALREYIESYCFGATAIIAAGEPYAEMPLSVPSVRTLPQILSDGEENLLSYNAEAATEPRCALPASLLSMSAEYKLPAGNRSMAYLSQLAALDSLEAQLTDARASGALFFFADRLNDTRPLISSSTLDYFGRWKAAHYGAQRLLSPVSILHKRMGYSVSFTAYNDRIKEYSGALTYRVLDSDNRELHRGTLECQSLASASSRELGTLNFAEYIDGYERERYLAYSYSDGIRTREATVLFVPKKHFKFKNPAIRATVSGSGKKFDVTLYSECFAGRVWLEFESTEALFSENGFDIIENAPRRITLETAEIISAERLERELKITTLYDAGRPSCEK